MTSYPNAMTHRNYAYFAFISYSRKDSRPAKWLQRRLEWFRFPVKLVPEEARPGHPKYVRPVYRDKTDLEVDHAHYWENIRKAIDQSRFMIVLCSPDSASSVPVDREVRHFLGNPERSEALASVVPVILRGSVGSGDDRECLCPALREQGESITSRNLPAMVPDADDGEKEGWESGFIGVASYMLGLRRQTLSDHCQREERKRARRARGLAVLFALLAITAVAGGVFARRQRNEARRQRDLAGANLATAYVSGSRAALARREPLVAAQLAEAAVGTARSLAARLAYWESISALPEERVAYAADVPRDNACVLDADRLAVADDTYVRRFERGQQTAQLTHGAGVVVDLVRDDTGQVWGLGEAGVLFVVAADFGSATRVHEMGSTCTSLSVARDGRRIAIGREDGVAVLLTVRVGGGIEPEREIDVAGPNRKRVQVGLSGDGTRLYAALSADAGHVSAYDTADGRQVWRTHEVGPERVAVSASGRYVAWYTTYGTVAAALAQGQRFLQFTSGRLLYGRIAFSPDETRLAYAAGETGDNGRVEELDLASGTAQCVYQAPCKLVTVQYASDTRLLSAGVGEGQWVDLPTVRKTFQAGDLVWRMAATADGTLRAFACGRPNFLDPTGGGTLTQRLATRSVVAWGLWPSVRGQAALLAVPGTRAALSEWGLPAGTVCGDVRPDGGAVIGSKDGTVAIAMDGKVQGLGTLSGAVGHVRAGPGGLLLVATNDFAAPARLARVSNSAMTAVAEIPGMPWVTASGFSPDGARAFVARSPFRGRVNDGMIAAVDTATGKTCGETALRACGTVRDVLVRPGGQLLAALASGELAVIDTASMALLRTVPVVNAPLFRLAEFPGEPGHVVAGDEEGALHVVDLAERRVIYSTAAMGVPVTALSTSPEEWVVAFGNRIECWSHVGDLEFTRQRQAKVRIWSPYDLQQQATTARENGNVEQALRLYQTIYRLRPQQISALREVVELQESLRQYEAALDTFAEVIQASRALGISEPMLSPYRPKEMILLKELWERDGNVEALNGAVRAGVLYLLANPAAARRTGAVHLVPTSLLIDDGRYAEAYAGLMALYPLLLARPDTPDQTITRPDVARLATICALAAGADPSAARQRLRESWDAEATDEPEPGRDALRALYLGQAHGDVLAARKDWQMTEKARVCFLLGVEARQQDRARQAAGHFREGLGSGDWCGLNRRALASMRGERVDGRITGANLALYRALGLLLDAHALVSGKAYTQAFQAGRQAWGLAAEVLPNPDAEQRQVLASIAVALTWAAALSGQAADAIAVAETCLPFLPPDTPQPLLMNLAHLHLLAGQYDQAASIYGRYKDMVFEGGRRWNDEVRNGFKLLREAGRDHPDMAKIEALLGTVAARKAE